MSQHDFSIANQTASSARTDINNALQALASCNSGTAAPSTTYANMLWYETDTNILKMRNEADNAWISLFYIDQTNNQIHLLDDTEVATSSGTKVGVLGDHADSTWTTGTNTEKRLVSPAQLSAAISSLAVSGVGVGQTWQSVSRSAGTVYQNTTGKPITVNYVPNAGSMDMYVSSDGTNYVKVTLSDSAAKVNTTVIVPAGHYYKTDTNATWAHWVELR